MLGLLLALFIIIISTIYLAYCFKGKKKIIFKLDKKDSIGEKRFNEIFQLDENLKKEINEDYVNMDTYIIETEEELNSLQEMIDFLRDHMKEKDYENL